jgi:dTDP-4-amino-4,6-dideoxygalactose transaminase
MSSPDLTTAEREAVAAVMLTPNLSMGGEIQAFEEAIQEYTGARHAIGVSSGTSGLHLCVRAAGIGDGDLVITSPFSFVASANVMLFERAIPVFVDVDPVTGNIDPLLVREAVADIFEGGAARDKWLPPRGAASGASLKGLLPIDVFGQPADWDHLQETAAEFGLTIIEDSCEALGAEYRERPAGVLGDMGVFAFYPNKQITTGEGAMIVTDDDEAADLMRALRNQGRSPGDTWLQHTHLGYNYRMNELSAALGKVQMTRLDKMLAKRAQVAGWYAERLADVAEIELPQVVESTSKMSWFVYVIRFAPEIDRDAAAAKLKENGIPCRPYFVPIHLQPYMAEKFGYREGDFPVTEDLGRRGLAIPFSGVMTEAQVEIVCEEIKEAIG